MTLTLATLARATRALSERAARSPVDHISWLPGQLEFLRHTGPEPVLYRAGNRQGKSTVGCAELIFRARGSHPFKCVPPAPVRLAIVCFSMVQSVAIQRVLWELLGGPGSEELVPGQSFSARTGFRGHRPVVEFANGSEIHVFSNAQGAEAISGAEYHWMLLDEPPAQEVFDECLARTWNVGGGVGITLTPINGPPLPWLQKLCERGEDGSDPRVRDIHVVLTPESQVSPLTGLIRRTKDGCPWDTKFIEKLRRNVNPIDEPIRIDGDWESRTEGQFFRCFDPAVHVSDKLPSKELRLALGVDFAAADRDLGMCATLSWVDPASSGLRDSEVWAWDEVVVPGTVSMEVFGRKVLKMLEDRGIAWHELDWVYGDNPARSRFTLSSNLELQKWIARHLGVQSSNLRPKIRSVKEGGGASGVTRRTKDIRCRWAYGAISAGRVRVHPRCKTLIRGLQEWDYGDRHPYKDSLDAWLYGLRDLWQEARRWGDAPPPTLRF